MNEKQKLIEDFKKEILNSYVIDEKNRKNLTTIRINRRYKLIDKKNEKTITYYNVRDLSTIKYTINDIEYLELYDLICERIKNIEIENKNYDEKQKIIEAFKKELAESTNIDYFIDNYVYNKSLRFKKYSISDLGNSFILRCDNSHTFNLADYEYFELYDLISKRLKHIKNYKITQEELKN